jgi:small nuclear ribonucleoprotein (snRNP)-like protein
MQRLTVLWQALKPSFLRFRVVVCLSRTPGNETSSANPLSTIYKYVHKKVSVFLKGGETYTGTLAKVDNYMNLVLEDTIEQSSDKTTKYGRVLIRGNNILLVQLL